MNAFHQTRILWQYRVALVFSLLVSVNASALGAVKLPHIFANHMVLQRDMQIPVWGFAEPGENITVKLDVHEVQTTTDANGQWLVKLPPMSVGGPHEMTVKGVNTVQLTDVLIGEVWVCSGQSNMQWSVKQSQNSEEEIAAANYPEIRLFDVPRVPSGVPAPDRSEERRVGERVC